MSTAAHYQMVITHLSTGSDGVPLGNRDMFVSKICFLIQLCTVQNYTGTILYRERVLLLISLSVVIGY